MTTKTNIVLTSKALFEKITCHYPAVDVTSTGDGQLLATGDLLFVYAKGKAVQAFRQNGTDAAYLGAEYKDIQAFTKVGWRTIWFNKAGKLLPDRIPVHDGEVRTLDALEGIPDLMAKPTLSQCLSWWDEWSLPENIRQHALTVARCAYILAVMMADRGINLDPILAHRGGMLHDLDKIETLHGAEPHGEPGAVFVEGKGYRELADIVRGHILHTILDPQSNHRSWENKLVFFCDKLVEGDQIVPFNERLNALKKRYPLYRETMEKAESAVWDLSDQICTILSIPDHDALVSILQQYY